NQLADRSAGRDVVGADVTAPGRRVWNIVVDCDDRDLCVQILKEADLIRRIVRTDRDGLHALALQVFDKPPLVLGRSVGRHLEFDGELNFFLGCLGSLLGDRPEFVGIIADEGDKRLLRSAVACGHECQSGDECQRKKDASQFEHGVGLTSRGESGLQVEDTRIASESKTAAAVYWAGGVKDERPGLSRNWFSKA